jgi:hypothetical protein
VDSFGEYPLLPVHAGTFAAHLVEEFAPGNRDQPTPGLSRRVLRPGFQRLNECCLHRVLGRREIRSAPDKHADYLWYVLTQPADVHGG